MVGAGAVADVRYGLHDSLDERVGVCLPIDDVWVFILQQEGACVYLASTESKLLRVTHDVVEADHIATLHSTILLTYGV